MNAVSPREATPAIRPQNFLELERFATMAAKSDFVPKDYRGRPDNIMVAIQMGSELGLAPMQSLQNISVINGRPSVWGDAMLALCRRSPLCEDVKETSEGEGDNLTAICLVRRRGASPVIVPFSVADAKKAGLWGKQGPWTQYPNRMLQMRARGFALRDAFPDLLRGLMSAEEAEDMPKGPTIDGATESQNETPAPKAKREQSDPGSTLSDKHPQVTQKIAPDIGGNGDEPRAKPSRKFSDLLEGLDISLAGVQSLDDYNAVVQSEDARAIMERGNQRQRDALEEHLRPVREKFMPTTTWAEEQAELLPPEEGKTAA